MKLISPARLLPRFLRFFAVLNWADRVQYRKNQRPKHGSVPQAHFPAGNRVSNFTGQKENSAKESGTLKSVNGPGSTFSLYMSESSDSRFPAYALEKQENRRRAAADTYANLLAVYVRRIPLLLRDLEFQLISAGDGGVNAGSGPVQNRLPSDGELEEWFENPLEPYAVTMHGLKMASYDILAFKAGKKAEELENAALTGDLELLKKKSPVFLNYMEYFVEELERYLKREASRLRV